MWSLINTCAALSRYYSNRYSIYICSYIWQMLGGMGSRKCIKIVLLKTCHENKMSNFSITNSFFFFYILRIISNNVWSAYRKHWHIISREWKSWRDFEYQIRNLKIICTIRNVKGNGRVEGTLNIKLEIWKLRIKCVEERISLIQLVFFTWRENIWNDFFFLLLGRTVLSYGKFPNLIHKYNNIIMIVFRLWIKINTCKNVYESRSTCVYYEI